MAVAFFSNFSPLGDEWRDERIRGEFINDNREFDIKFETFFGPLVSNGNIVNISKDKLQHENKLFTNVINTVHHGELVVATNVIGGGIDTLQ